MFTVRVFVFWTLGFLVKVKDRSRVSFRYTVRFKVWFLDFRIYDFCLKSMVQCLIFGFWNFGLNVLGKRFRVRVRLRVMVRVRVRV